MDGDRLSAEEARVFEGVGGHQRHLLLGHHLQDRARDRDVLGVRPFDELRQLRDRSSVLVEQDQQTALDRQVLEDHVHHDVEERVEVVALQHRFRHLHEDLEDLLARHPRFGFDARLGCRTRRQFLRLGEVEIELRVEVGDAADDGARRVVEHRLAGEIDRRHAAQLELDGTDQDLVAGVDGRLRDEVAVDLHAVRRLQVDDPPMTIARLESRMFARHRRMVEDEIVPLGATN